ncbi:MAG: type II CAAX endopeptidase family protein [Nocardioides sp.]
MSAYGQPPPPMPPLRGLPPVPDGMPYHRLQVAGRHGFWRPLAGVLIMAAAFAVIQFLAILPFALFYVVTGANLSASLTTLADIKHPTPVALAYLNVALALLIPSAIAVTWFLHGLTPGWLASVARRMRWRLLLACLGASVVALIATLVASGIVNAVAPGQSSDVGGQLNPFTSTTAWYIVVILLLTPLQAAGEEYCFRGYLTQAFGGIPIWSAWFAVLVPAALFGIAHGIGQSPPVFFDRFAFGVVAGILVIRTGGLEAGIAMHVLNNFVAYGLALTYGDMASTLNPTGGSWWSIPVTLTQSLVYLALATWVCRRLGGWTTTGGGVLEAPSSRV